MVKVNFFSDYGEVNRYQIQEIIGKGSYGLVCSAIDKQTGEKVAIKKITNVFEHVSDATRILREIKLLRFLRHPDIVQIKHILLPSSPRDFKDIYVVFELMQADLHEVIKANDDLAPEHFQYFLYQLLRAMKFLHTANVFHRDLKPKNVLANSDCKLKICDFGLARVTFTGSSSAIFWTDYVATRWYRAPELCGSFYTKYTTAVDIWSIGCIFAELLTGKPLFPGKNVVHQLDLITDLLGTPSEEVISQIINEKAKWHLNNMRKKPPFPFQQKFPHVDPMAVRLLKRLLEFDPKDRLTAQEALAHPYFKGLANIEQEPSSLPIAKADFDFERKRLTEDDVRGLIYREILEYHPQMLKQYLSNHSSDQSRFFYASAIDKLKRQFDSLQSESDNFKRRDTSLPRKCLIEGDGDAGRHAKENDVVQCLGQNKNTEIRAPLEPHEFLSKNNNDPSTSKSVDEVRKQGVMVAKSASFHFSQRSNTNSSQSKMKPQTSFNTNLRLGQYNDKDFVNDAKTFQPRSRFSGVSVANLGDSDVKPTNDQDSYCKQDEVMVNESEVVGQPRTRSMGTRVAKLVAAFSNGMSI